MEKMATNGNDLKVNTHTHTYFQKENSKVTKGIKSLEEQNKKHNVVSRKAFLIFETLEFCIYNFTLLNILLCINKIK